MSTDIERVTNGLKNLHSIWASLIECIVATYLLWTELCAASITPFAVAIASAAGSAYLTTFVQARQAVWMKSLESRVGMYRTAL